MDSHLNIRTPENVDLNFEVAGIGSRFLAVAVDTIIIVAVIALVVLGIALLQGFIPQPLGVAYNVLIAIALFAMYFFFTAYFIVFEMATGGRTPGKMLLHLRVINKGGYAVSFLNSVIRNILRIVDFLPALYLAGIVTMFISQLSCRLGDLAGGTIVVREKKTSIADLGNVGNLSPSGLAAYTLDPLVVGQQFPPEMLDIVSSLLTRRGKIDPFAYWRLSYDTASTIACKLGYSSPLVSEYEVDAWLRGFYTAYTTYQSRT